MRTCAAWFIKKKALTELFWASTEWKENIEFLSNTDDLYHDPFEAASRRLPHYLKFDFALNEWIPAKQKHKNTIKPQNVRKEEAIELADSLRKKFGSFTNNSSFSIIPSKSPNI